ncbi:MAG: hypothetical protein LBH77_10050 [Tannerella sp.]|jgi:hypothetical protein|nr:hypothetical protein [Tannerella sp.]
MPNNNNKMIINRKTVCLLFIISVASTTINKGFAEGDDWREKMKYLQYAPRYFGPNAFPMPELRSGLLGTQWEAELRGEYHIFEGDRTKDVYTRLFVPVAEGRAGFEIGCVVYEYYNMTGETVEERHAAGKSWDNGAQGDVVVSSFYQLLRSGKWADILLEATLKTASGNRLADARYTDAAAYWFLLNIGRDVYKRPDNKLHLRMQGLAGFYCWMTNDPVHRQNDAFVYSAGISGACKNFTVNTGISGFYGYKNNGDRPLQLRTELNYRYRKNILSFRYKHGMKDALYDTFSFAYIRHF